jgi:hypothetical protein
VELHDPYSTSDSTGKTKSRVMDEVRLVVDAEQRRTEYRTLIELYEGKSILYDLNSDDTITVKWKRK